MEGRGGVVLRSGGRGIRRWRRERERKGERKVQYCKWCFDNLLRCRHSPAISALQCKPLPCSPITPHLPISFPLFPQPSRTSCPSSPLPLNAPPVSASHSP